ncbi:ABC transporter permease [Anaerosporobacter faecicola]|uniref:ABC transporter permease n=1 Tax=Anaerosporobacter faecicola TaxID=2718714 RepID=UPI001438EC61|nr:ABC transporter permease [Anaerosporobacter faecicola]
MRGAKEIIKKELNRVFGDKKLIFSLFILPVALMVGMCFLMGNLMENMEDDVDAHIPTVYIQNAPEELNDAITAAGFQANITNLAKEDSLDSIKDDIINGEKDLLVTFDDGFMEKIQNYTDGAEIPEVRTYYNPSEEYSSTARTNFVTMVLEPMKQSLLAARIGNLDNITIFNIDLDLGASQIMDDQKASGKALGMMLPYFITMLLFAGVMSIAVDAITGEKERGTLASMLVSPVRRVEIVTGKLVSIAILSSISAIIYAISMVFALPKMMGGLSGEINISLSPLQIVQLIVIMLSLVFLYVSLVSIVSVFAKTMKEANTYVTPMYILVIVAGMITMFSGNTTPDTAMFAIPVYGNALCIQNIMEGDLLMSQFLAAVGGTVLLGVIVTAGIVKAFNSEKVMFNA